MADQAGGKSKKTEQSFGLDGQLVSNLDWKRALNRIVHDLRSDFIWAPHIRFLYRALGDDLIKLVQSDLKNGTFHPGIPLTIEVPKSFRIKVGGGHSQRLGPSFTRPGSILLPKDRLLYQVIADQAAPIVESNTDKTRSFSHRLADDDDEAMFLPNRKCWSELQKKLKAHAAKEKSKYILRVDVADYFGSINQHTLINTLKGYSFDSSLAEKLERMLLSYSGQRSSRGILQGIYPSDLFGAFYMAPVDRFFDEIDVLSARYVDDIYIFVGSVDEADQVLRKLVPFLRSYDLHLNEVKSTVVSKSALFAEEPDLEQLFSDAVEEISDQFDDDETDADYGFQREWDDEEDEEDEEDQKDLELQATQALFDSIDKFPGQEEAIERFCLPLFTKAESDYAVDHVLEQFSRRPSMTQIYAAYLGKFVGDDEDIREALVETLSDETFFDWQKMWIVATLMQANVASNQAVKIVMSLLIDANRHDGLRAAAALFVGRFGDHDRRKALFTIYKTVAEYVQLAIYFSSRSWPPVERKNARDSWGGHGQLHKLVSKGLAELKS
jgi:hypothetical protein